MSEIKFGDLNVCLMENIFIWFRTLTVCGESLTVCPATALLPCRLEAEIKEARLRAREEAMQGIQVAEELARHQLSSQRAAFEGRIQALEAELVGAAGAGQRAGGRGHSQPWPLIPPHRASRW